MPARRSTAHCHTLQHTTTYSFFLSLYNCLHTRTAQGDTIYFIGLFYRASYPQGDTINGVPRAGMKAIMEREEERVSVQINGVALNKGDTIYFNKGDTIYLNIIAFIPARATPFTLTFINVLQCVAVRAFIFTLILTFIITFILTFKLKPLSLSLSLPFGLSFSQKNLSLSPSLSLPFF